MKYPRLAGNISYTLRYNCLDCGKENIFDVSVYIPKSERPRELSSCMFCDSTNIQHIKEEERQYSVAVITNIMRLDGVSRHRTSSEFKERLSEIHKNNYGSVIDKTSNLTKI